MRYTKDNGETSLREVVVVSEPRANYLVYDVTKLSNKDLDVLRLALEQTEVFRDNALADFDLVSELKLWRLWRSFKPEGIEWIEEDD
jgi:hypothetical protein